MGHSRFFHGAILLVLALSLAPPALAGLPARSDSAITATADSESGRVADSLFTALKKKDYSAAFRLFNASMKAAVPEEKLAALWNGQITSIGNFLSWDASPGPPKQGLDLILAALKFEGGELRAAVYVDPHSRLVAGFFVRPASVPDASPAAYVDTTKFHAVEVTVGSKPFILGGTLTVPIGRGPFPGVVLVHGSGPQDRDETIGANKVFKDLAEGLSSHGIAVLRYDKRTRQYGAKMAGAASLEEEVMIDATAAVQLLRTRGEVDRSRIFVVGHSLGALLAPEIAVRSAPIAGVVLLAPPGRPPWEMVLAQMRYLDAPSEDLAETERMIALLKQGKLGEEKFLDAPQSYWLDWASRDGIAMAKKLGRPVLILRGGRDFQVTEEDVENWRKGLSGVPNVEIVAIPGLNHLFEAGSGKPGLAEYDTPGHVDARVIESISSFMAPGSGQGRSAK